jgi:hypothetical protein
MISLRPQNDHDDNGPRVPGGWPVFGSIKSVDQPVNTDGDPQPGRTIPLAGRFLF